MPESSLTVRAELAALRKDIAAGTDMTEGQVEKMLIGLERRLKGAEKAAKVTAKAQQDAAKAAGDWNAKLAGLQQVASTLPGPLSQIATMSLNAASMSAWLLAKRAFVVPPFLAMLLSTWMAGSLLTKARPIT